MLCIFFINLHQWIHSSWLVLIKQYVTFLTGITMAHMYENLDRKWESKRLRSECKIFTFHLSERGIGIWLLVMWYREWDQIPDQMVITRAAVLRSDPAACQQVSDSFTHSVLPGHSTSTLLRWALYTSTVIEVNKNNINIINYQHIKYP